MAVILVLTVVTNHQASWNIKHTTRRKV